MQRLKYIVIILSLIGNVTIVSAQQMTRLTYDVTENNKILKSPFAGGLNIPQIYNIDLDGNGIQDIVMMDREGAVILPFLRENDMNGTDNLVFSPSYKNAFDGIREWFVVRDYNADGIADIFCFPSNNLPGIEVRKGRYENGKIAFDIVPFTDDPSKPNILLYPSFSGLVNIYVGSNDQPEIIDVDDDGDMDILTFDVGGSYMNYYKNYALENGMDVDTFSFVLEDLCWGKFFERNMSEVLLLSDDADNCATPFTDDPVVSNRHSGSTVTAFDRDGDGDLDMLLGDLASKRLMYLENYGSSENAWIKSQVMDFPRNDVPVFLDLFNAGFFIDINNDKKRDLLVSPNSTSLIENHDVVWYYNNSGSDSAPIFEFVQEDLFVEDMIDLGSDSSPKFVDNNGDGLLDIIVGTRGIYLGPGMTNARMVLYENIGTLDNPAFILKDSNYGGYAQFGSSALIFSPGFGDIDGDGDIDMLVGDNNGDLYYSQNIAGAGMPFEFAPAVYKFMDIVSGNKAKPVVADINRDGLGDIVIGQKRNIDNGQGLIGGLIYYPNIGSVGNPVFEGDRNESPNILAFGGVNTQVIGFSESFAAPDIYDIGDDFILVTGSISGRVNAYNNIQNNLDGSFDALYTDWGNIREGESSTVSVADINNNGRIDLIIGNKRGGLSLFETNLTTSGTVSNERINLEDLIELYPNPVNNQFRILAEDLNITDFTISIYNMDSKLLFQVKGDIDQYIDISQLVTGLYIVKIQSDDGNYVKKILKN